MKQTTKLSALLVACTAAATVFTSTGAGAQQFPSKNITLTVGYTAGGQADAMARAVGKGLSEALKTTVVVENKPGANGLLAAQAVANAKPDGHTILFVTDAMMTIDPQLPGTAQWDPSAALTPITTLGEAPLFLAANKDVPVDSVPAVVEFGKKNPDALSFGTSGSATPHRMAGEMLQKLGGFQMKHIPYKGTAASVTDLAGGQITLAFGASTSLEPLAKAGKIKLIAVTSDKRSPLMPDVPAISETYPGFNFVTYFGLMVPKNTPAPVIETLNREVNKVLANPDLKEPLQKLGVVPVGGTPAEFQARVKADYEARGAIIRELNIKAD
jgi:tripartite-type tricarboxylate transporter receptor subunit TctC